MTLLNESYHVDMEFALFDHTMESVHDTDAIFESSVVGNKIADAISRLIKKVKDFISNAIAKLKSLFTKNKVDENIKMVNEIKNDPAVASETIQMVDTKAIDADLDAYEKTVESCEKKGDTVTKDDIEKLIKHQKKCSAKKPLITIGIIAGIAGLGVSMKTVNARMKKNLDAVNLLDQKYDRAIDRVSKAQNNDLSKAEGNPMKEAITNYKAEVAKAKIDVNYQKTKRDILYSSWFNRLCTRAYHLKNGTVYNNAKLKDERKYGEYQGKLDVLKSDTYKDLAKGSARREKQLTDQIDDLKKAVSKKTADQIERAHQSPSKSSRPKSKTVTDAIIDAFSPKAKSNPPQRKPLRKSGNTAVKFIRNLMK